MSEWWFPASSSEDPNFDILFTRGHCAS